jgi:CheY-like chemotaxis protein
MRAASHPRERFQTGIVTMSVPPERDSTRMPHVLLVGEHADTCEMYAMSLTLAGFRVDQADSASDARKHMVTMCPNVLVLDIAFPRTDWIDLCRHQNKPPALVAITSLSLGDPHTDQIPRHGTRRAAVQTLLADDLRAEVRHGRAIRTVFDNG